MQKLLLAFKKNFKMSKPQLKPSREGEAGSELAGARQCAQKWATICGNSAHADCRQLLTPACLPASLPACLAASSSRLLDQARAGYVCLFALPCLLYYYIQTPAQARPGQEASIWPTNARHAAWVSCNPPPPPRCRCHCSRTFPLIFLHAVWACGARTGTETSANPPFPLSVPRQRFLCIYSWPLSIDRVDKAYPFSLLQQIRANATGRGI